MGGGYMLSDNSIVYFIIYNPIMWIAIIWVLLLAYSEWYHRKKYGKYNNSAIIHSETVSIYS